MGITPEVTAGLDITFPEVHRDPAMMARLALAIKRHDGSAFCEMPFCHTVEAEAMGGSVNLGDACAGPRAREYMTESIEDILKLPAVDYSKGRAADVLLACQKLHEAGEHVVLDLSGPFTILNVLIDVKFVFRAMRRNPELMREIFWKIGEEQLRYAKEAITHGVEIISYADSAGGLNIIGPKMAEEVEEGFTCGFVKRLSEVTAKNALLLLCPKTSFALVGMERAEFLDRPLSAPMSFGEACVESVGKIGIAGQTCIKDINFRLETGTIKEVVLK